MDHLSRHTAHVESVLEATRDLAQSRLEEMERLEGLASERGERLHVALQDLHDTRTSGWWKLGQRLQIDRVRRLWRRFVVVLRAGR